MSNRTKKRLLPQDIPVYEFIERYYSLNGFSPSLRDIKRALGHQTLNQGRYSLNRLERMGWISREPHTSRAIVPIKQPRTYYIERENAQTNHPDLSIDGWLYIADDHADSCPDCNRVTASTDKQPNGLTDYDCKPDCNRNR